MKLPINPTDIQVGDTVVLTSHGFETKFTVDHIDEGRLYAQPGNADHDSAGFLWGRDDPGVQWFLIDRPTLPGLPDEPALGSVELYNGDRHQGLVHVQDNLVSVDDMVIGSVTAVTAFTPMTAVPTAALEALRDETAGVPLPHAVFSFIQRVNDAAQAVR